MAIGYYIPKGKAHELVLQLYYASKVLEQSQRNGDIMLSRDLAAMQKILGNMMQEQDAVSAATPRAPSVLMDGPADHLQARPSTPETGEIHASTKRG